VLQETGFFVPFEEPGLTTRLFETLDVLDRVLSREEAELAASVDHRGQHAQLSVGGCFPLLPVRADSGFLVAFKIDRGDLAEPLSIECLRELPEVLLVGLHGVRLAIPLQPFFELLAGLLERDVLRLLPDPRLASENLHTLDLGDLQRDGLRDVRSDPDAVVLAVVLETQPPSLSL
jgi:hypothetical protein